MHYYTYQRMTVKLDAELSHLRAIDKTDLFEAIEEKNNSETWSDSCCLSIRTS